VLARCGKLLVVAALVLTTGLHWAALQTLAWTTMLANNLCEQTFTEAVARTFDGEHPCPLCKAIAAGKKSEKKSEAVAPTLKMEFPPVAENSRSFHQNRFQFFCRLNFSLMPAPSNRRCRHRAVSSRKPSQCCRPTS